MRCGWLLVGIGVMGLVLCLSSVGRAADHPDEGGVSAVESEFGKEIKHEAPKNRDLFGWAMDLGIWTLLIFLLLLLILGKFAWKPMLQGLEHREKSIHAALHEAQQAREEAARLHTQLEEQMRKANDQARDILDEARRAAERSTAEMTAEAHKKLQADQDRFQREMALQAEQARRELQMQVAQLATLVASKAIRRQVNSDDQRQLVDEALAEMRQAGDGRSKTALV